MTYVKLRLFPLKNASAVIKTITRKFGLIVALDHNFLVCSNCQLSNLFDLY